VLVEITLGFWLSVVLTEGLQATNPKNKQDKISFFIGK
jgi:hypothetical protein